MEDNFNSTVHEVVEKFETILTTEDMRSGIDRRHVQTRDFPLQDNSAMIIEEERRFKDDRRYLEIDIDDISEYTREVGQEASQEVSQEVS